MSRRHVIAGAVAALFSGAASADPASLIALGSALGAASGIGAATLGALAAKGAWLVGGMIISSALQRSEQRAANRAARAKAIGELQARTVTALQADPPWRVIYGEATVGGDIHAIITHDKTNGKREDGSTYIRPDAYKSLVIVWADHQCKGVKTVLINGIDIGSVDGNGWVTGGTYTSTGVDPRRAQFAGAATSITVDEAIVEVLSCTSVINGGHYPSTYTLSNGNKTVTVTGVSGPGGTVTARWLNYTVSKGTPRVRVEHYRGTSTQTASPYLTGVAPAQWTALHRLRGKCYSIVTLDLEDSRFQGGWGDIMAVVEGHDLIADPRAGTSGYSANPALICNNWLLSPWGYGDEITVADIDQARLIAAANACDVSTSYTEGATTITGPRYTCNGGLTTDQGKEPVLEDLRESMAGHVAFDGQWLIDAGAWSAPVLDITDADLAGPIELVQAGAPSGELYNGIRAQYLPPRAKAVADADNYSNATLAAADGRGLWGDLTLPFTNSKSRCRQISRVVVERSRDGQILRIPLKRRGLRLQVGDRLRLTNAEYGLTLKTFRITDSGVAPRATLTVTAQEDAAAVYDTADASSADPNPNTGLQSPLIVAAMGAITVTSGTADLIILQDGTVVPRVKVAWAAVTDPYVIVSGYVEARWRAVDSLVWTDWRQAPGDALAVYLDGVTERMPILIEARLRNALGYAGASTYAAHIVVGKLAPPAAVTGLIATVSGGQALIAMDPCPEADYFETEVRVGPAAATWATATRLGVGNQNVFAWMPYPATGTYAVLAVHRDSSGNESSPQAIVATVTAAGITSAASGTNLVMNGDFYRRNVPAGDPARPYDPEGYGVYDWGVGVSGVWGWANETSVAGERAFALETVTAMPAKPDSGGQPVRLGLVTGSSIQGGLTQGGVSGGWRPNADYTISFDAHIYRNGAGAATESEITHVATTSGAAAVSGGGAVTVTRPAGVAVNDLLLIVFTFDRSPSGETFNVSGWIRVGAQQNQSGPDGQITTAWYKIATSGDAAAAGFEIVSDIATVTNPASWVCSAYRGVDATSPVATTGAWGVSTAAGTTPPTAPGITTTGNTALVWIGATDQTNGTASTLSAPSGYALRAQAQTGGSWNGIAAIADKLPKAANGTVAAVASGAVTGGVTFGYAAVLLALRPATSGGGGSVPVATEWDGVMKPDMFWNVYPATAANDSDVQTITYTPRRFKFKLRTGASTESQGAVYVGVRRIDAATQMPGLAAGARLVIRNLMVHQGTDYPVFERAPQDDLRPGSIVTGAIATDAVNGVMWLFDAAGWVRNPAA